MKGKLEIDSDWMMTSVFAFLAVLAVGMLISAITGWVQGEYERPSRGWYLYVGVVYFSFFAAILSGTEYRSLRFGTGAIAVSYAIQLLLQWIEVSADLFRAGSIFLSFLKIVAYCFLLVWLLQWFRRRERLI